MNGNSEKQLMTGNPEQMLKSALKTPEELVKATEQSVRGFRAVLFGEKAFRTDLVVFFVFTVIACALPVTWCERALMIYTVFMGLMAEIINTAIETVVDRISTEYHELSGRAKDIGSALVFFAFFGAGIAWFVILLGLGLRLARESGWL
jgi:diacylglycerol kinase (ATP)